MTATNSDDLQQLFIALTARWRKDDENLAVGINQRKLLEALEINKENLGELLEQLKSKIEELGMELIEYIYQGETWYAIRSSYSCPGEITKEEEATLAVVIGYMESQKKPEAAEVSLPYLKKKLVGGKIPDGISIDPHPKTARISGIYKKKSPWSGLQPKNFAGVFRRSPPAHCRRSQKIDFLISASL